MPGPCFRVICQKNPPEHKPTTLHMRLKSKDSGRSAAAAPPEIEPLTENDFHVTATHPRAPKIKFLSFFDIENVADRITFKVAPDAGFLALQNFEELTESPFDV